MVEVVATLFIAAGVALALWWTYADRAEKAAGFAACALAILAGVTLLMREQVARLAVDEIETIEAAAARASSEADAIGDLRARIEAEAKSATGRVAAHAAEARRLAAETTAALAKSKQQLSQRAEPARAGPPSASPGRALPSAASEPSAHPLAVVAASLRGTGSHEVTLTTSLDDADAIALAIRLKEAIEAGGWIVHLNQIALEPPVSGVQVLAPVPLQPHVTTLLGALGRAGLQPRGLAGRQAQTLEVLVGSRPRQS